jgi:Uri superfamily endonuclease
MKLRMEGATARNIGARSASAAAAEKGALPDEPQTYQLHIEVGEEVRVTVGRLGECVFPAGRYIYTGSAKRNLEARLRRHLSRSKRLHWHIDYLLAAPGVRVVSVARFAAPECQLNRQTAGTLPVPRFGSTDCRAGCGSHLKYQGRDGFGA